jgi:hypothetical protein
MQQNNNYTGEINQNYNKNKRIKRYTSEGKPIFE